MHEALQDAVCASCAAPVWRAWASQPATSAAACDQSFHVLLTYSGNRLLQLSNVEILVYFLLVCPSLCVCLCFLLLSVSLWNCTFTYLLCAPIILFLIIPIKQSNFRNPLLFANILCDRILFVCSSVVCLLTLFRLVYFFELVNIRCKFLSLCEYQSKITWTLPDPLWNPSPKSLTSWPWP